MEQGLVVWLELLCPTRRRQKVSKQPARKVSAAIGFGVQHPWSVLMKRDHARFQVMEEKEGGGTDIRNSDEGVEEHSQSVLVDWREEF